MQSQKWFHNPLFRTFPDFRPFLSIIVFFPLIVWFWSNRDGFAPMEFSIIIFFFHNYFFSIIVREESQWLELCKQSEYVCTFNSKIVHNPAHTSRTAQRLFSLFPLYCTYVWLLSVHTAIMRLKELCMYLQGCAVQPMTTYSQQFSMYGLFCMWILYSKLFILIDPGQNVS